MRNYVIYDYFTKEGYYLTQPYGTNKYHDYRQYGLLFHEGVDLGNKNKKAHVRCPLPQAVVVQDWDIDKSNYGNHVVLWDYEQLCAIWLNHLDWNEVKIGDKLKAGDVIGEMGDSGFSSAEHVHINFVITDKNGNRLYTKKTQNLGFLDPQYPKDPGAPINMPGVPEYRVDWKKPSTIHMPDDQVCFDKKTGDKLIGNSIKWDKVHEYFKMPGKPENTPFNDVKKLIDQKSKRLDELVTENANLQTKLVEAEQEIRNRIDQIANIKSKCQREGEAKEVELSRLSDLLKKLDKSQEKYLLIIKSIEEKLRIAQVKNGKLAKDLKVTQENLKMCNKGTHQKGQTYLKAILDYLSGLIT